MSICMQADIIVIIIYTISLQCLYAGLFTCRSFQLFVILLHHVVYHMKLWNRAGWESNFIVKIKFLWEILSKKHSRHDSVHKQTERTDRQTAKVKPVYPTSNLVEAGVKWKFNKCMSHHVAFGQPKSNQWWHTSLMCVHIYEHFMVP